MLKWNIGAIFENARKFQICMKNIPKGQSVYLSGGEKSVYLFKCEKKKLMNKIGFELNITK